MEVFMEIKITEMSRVFSETGVALLSASIDLVSFEGKGAGRAEKYFKQINDTYLNSIEGSLFPRLQGEYISNPDKKRRFTYRRLDFSHRITVQAKTDKYISLTRTLSLKRRGKELYLRVSGDVISQKSGRILPINVFMPRMRLFRLTLAMRKKLGERVKLSSFYINAEQKLVLIYTAGGMIYECLPNKAVIRTYKSKMA